MSSILIVEDDPNLAVVLNEFLSQHGYNVEVCERPEHAYDLLQKKNYNFLVISNRTKGVAPMEFLHKISHKGEGLLVIYVSPFIHEEIEFIKKKFRDICHVKVPVILEDIKKIILANLARVHLN